MVAMQIRARGVISEAVLNAMCEVPRELFVPPEYRSQAYEDCPLPIGHGQSISQPFIVAYMLQELNVAPGHKVLDVGAGSGYQTALLARMVAHVYAVERIAALTERATKALAAMNIHNVTFATRDGSLGWPEAAPFDRIICGAGGPDVPPPWIDQLAPGGRIVMPVGGEVMQTLVAVDKTPAGIRRRELLDVRFVKLLGQAAWPEAGAHHDLSQR